MSTSCLDSFAGHDPLVPVLRYQNALQNRFETGPAPSSSSSSPADVYVSQILAANGFSQHPEATENRHWQQRHLREEERIKLLKNYYFNKLNFASTTAASSARYMDVQKVWQPVLSLGPYYAIVRSTGASNRAPGSGSPHVDADDVLLDSGAVLLPPSVPPPEPPAPVPPKFDLDSHSNSSVGADHSAASLISDTHSTASSVSTSFSVGATNRAIVREFPKLANGDEFRSSFLSYTNCPTLYGQDKLPPLMFHCTAAASEKVVVFGGLRFVEPQDQRTHDISKIKVKGPSYPFPLKDDLLNNPSLVNNQRLYVVDSDTDIVLFPEVSGDVPPALCCATATVIADRYVFYYGGFEIKTTFVACDKNGNFYLERDFAVNSKAWILDTAAFRFRQIELAPDPNAALKVPIKLERFGHSAVASELRVGSAIGNITSYLYFAAGSSDGSSATGIPSASPFRDFNAHELGESTVSLFVFGGYSYNQHTKKFSCSNYNWKIDLAFTNERAGNVLKFQKKALYSCMESLNEGPAPRGFHAAILLDEEVKSNKLPIGLDEDDRSGSILAAGDNATMRTSSTKNSQKSRDNLFYSYSLATTALQAGAQDANGYQDTNGYQNGSAKSNQVMLIHGGSNLSNLFGNLWKYSFATKRWQRIKAKTNKYNANCSPSGELFESDLHRAYHKMIMLDKYLLFIGGFGSKFVLGDLLEARKKYNQSPNYSENWLPDTYDTVAELISNLKGAYIRTIMLDLNTSTWIFAKVTHRTTHFHDYNAVFFPKVPKELPRIKQILEKGDEHGLKQLLVSQKFTDEEAQMLAFIMRCRGMVSNHLNTLGGDVCLVNGRVCMVGGSLLCHQDDKVKITASYNSPLVSRLLKRGLPLGVLLMLELPIFAQSCQNTHKNEMKFLLIR